MTSPWELTVITNHSKALVAKSQELYLEALHTTAVAIETNKTIGEYIDRMHQEIKDLDTTIIGFKNGNTLISGKPTPESTTHKLNPYLFQNQLIK